MPEVNIYFIIYRLYFDGVNESADEYLISTFITSNTDIENSSYGTLFIPFEGIALTVSN